MGKLKVGVLMGGISTEREVSILTGENMFSNLDTEKYEGVRIVLDSKADVLEKCRDIDFALLALHGKFGEDGEVQAVLESMGIPYSGSDVKSSSISMDKDISKRLIKFAGVRVADWVMARNEKDIEEKVIPFLKKKGKIVVKPNSGGSSVMTFICTDEEETANAVKAALTVDNEVMAEEFIKGTEITVSILDGEVLPTIMITSPDGFFDYEAKYKDVSMGGAKEEVVKLEENLQKEVDQMSLKTYEVLKCSVYGRVDMLVKEGKPYVLEINTLPGMTATSLIPRAAASVGISYKDLVNRIIETSLKERAR